VRLEDRRAEGNDGDTKRQHHGRRTSALPNITTCSVTKDVGCETNTSGTVVNPTIQAALVLMVLMTGQPYDGRHRGSVRSRLLVFCW
jgi:hypothetical protein